MMARFDCGFRNVPSDDLELYGKKEWHSKVRFPYMDKQSKRPVQSEFDCLVFIDCCLYFPGHFVGKPSLTLVQEHYHSHEVHKNAA